MSGYFQIWGKRKKVKWSGKGVQDQNLTHSLKDSYLEPKGSESQPVVQ